MSLYLVFHVVALWPSHGLVYPYFTDPKTEISQVGGIDYSSSSRPVFNFKIEATVEVE